MPSRIEQLMRAGDAAMLVRPGSTVAIGVEEAVGGVDRVKIQAALKEAAEKAGWKVGDRGLIDGLIVNGSARTIGVLSGFVKRVQTGFLYHYAFIMIVALVAMIAWFVLRG